MTTRPNEHRAAPRRPSRWRGIVVCAVLSLPLMALPAGAAGGASGAATPTVSIEQEPLHHRTEAVGSTAQEARSLPGPTASASGDLSHVILALAIVVGLIVGLRWVARRFSLVPSVGRPGRGVKLLSRTVLAPKQQVLLLQVGRRIVVVGDGGAAGMRALCEITEPNEVASLLGELKSSDSHTSGSKSFGSLFGRASEPFSGADAELPALATPPGAGAGDEVSSDVVGLLDKVRGLRQQFDR